MGLHLVSLQVFEIYSRKNENFSNQRFDILNNNRKEYVYCECKFLHKKSHKICIIQNKAVSLMKILGPKP